MDQVKYCLKILNIYRVQNEELHKKHISERRWALSHFVPFRNKRNLKAVFVCPFLQLFLEENAQKGLKIEGVKRPGPHSYSHITKIT